MLVPYCAKPDWCKWRHLDGCTECGLCEVGGFAAGSGGIVGMTLPIVKHSYLVTSVNDIAEQSHLLALNAAIQAAASSRETPLKRPASTTSTPSRMEARMALNSAFSCVTSRSRASSSARNASESSRRRTTSTLAPI